MWGSRELPDSDFFEPVDKGGGDYQAFLRVIDRLPSPNSIVKSQEAAVSLGNEYNGVKVSVLERGTRHLATGKPDKSETVVSIKIYDDGHEADFEQVRGSNLADTLSDDDQRNKKGDDDAELTQRVLSKALACDGGSDVAGWVNSACGLLGAGDESHALKVRECLKLCPTGVRKGQMRESLITTPAGSGLQWRATVPYDADGLVKPSDAESLTVDISESDSPVTYTYQRGVSGGGDWYEKIRRSVSGSGADTWPMGDEAYAVTKGGLKELTEALNRVMSSMTEVGQETAIDFEQAVTEVGLEKMSERIVHYEDSLPDSGAEIRATVTDWVSDGKPGRAAVAVTIEQGGYSYQVESLLGGPHREDDEPDIHREIQNEEGLAVLRSILDEDKSTGAVREMREWLRVVCVVADGTDAESENMRLAVIGALVDDYPGPVNKETLYVCERHYDNATDVSVEVRMYGEDAPLSFLAAKNIYVSAQGAAEGYYYIGTHRRATLKATGGVFEDRLDLHEGDVPIEGVAPETLLIRADDFWVSRITEVLREAQRQSSSSGRPSR